MAEGYQEHGAKYKKTKYVQNIEINANSSTNIDLSTYISDNCPDGYVFDHFEFAGYWPMSTWTNALVCMCNRGERGAEEQTAFFTASSNQRYTISIFVWYRG